MAVDDEVQIFGLDAAQHILQRLLHAQAQLNFLDHSVKLARYWLWQFARYGFHRLQNAKAGAQAR